MNCKKKIQVKAALTPIKEQHHHWRKVKTTIKTGFLKRLDEKKINEEEDDPVTKKKKEEEAATRIQATYRGFSVRKEISEKPPEEKKLTESLKTTGEGRRT